jgi:hypothetical protein
MAEPTSEELRLVPAEPTEAMARAGAYQVSGVTREGARCIYRAMLATAAQDRAAQPAPAELRVVARLAALAGLGTVSGESGRQKPNDKWEQGEWERRILECIPSAVEQRCFALADAILSALAPHIAAREAAAEARGRQNDKTWWMLSIIEKMGGTTSANADENEWINFFCDDGDPGTFHQAIDAGLLRVTHNDLFDTSEAHLTEVGLEWLRAPASPRRDQTDA